MATRFRALTKWTTLEVVSEPRVVITFRGYTAAVEVLDIVTNEQYELLMGGIKSLAEGIEPIRQANGGLFTGIRFRIKKESAERTSPYVIEPVDTEFIGDRVRDFSDAYDPMIGPKLSSEDRLWKRIAGRHGM